MNNEVVSNGRDSESRKLSIGDVVEILINMDAADALVIEKADLTVLHIQSGLALLSKACGVSAAFDKELDKALKAKLWGGRRQKQCQLLYHLEKGFSGICIVAETPEHLHRLRTLACGTPNADNESTVIDSYEDSYTGNKNILVDDSFATADDSAETDQEESLNKFIAECSQKEAQQECSPFLEIIHRCIICGKIGEVGETVFLETGHVNYQVRTEKEIQELE